MNLDEMSIYLKEAIEFKTARDIYELPREEFTPYVNRCKQLVPPAAIPYVVLVLIEEERSSIAYKIKRFIKSIFTRV